LPPRLAKEFGTPSATERLYALIFLSAGLKQLVAVR